MSVAAIALPARLLGASGVLVDDGLPRAPERSNSYIVSSSRSIAVMQCAVW